MNLQFIIMIFGGLIFFFVFLYFVPVNLWITALFSGVQLDLMELVFMRIRKSPMKQIILSLITCHKAGVAITLQDLETHALAAGDVVKLTKALVRAKSEELDIPTSDLMAQNLAGQDLIKYIEDRKRGETSGMDDLKRKLCAKIMNDLNEDQLRDVEKYIGAY